MDNENIMMLFQQLGELKASNTNLEKAYEKLDSAVTEVKEAVANQNGKMSGFLESMEKMIPDIKIENNLKIEGTDGDVSATQNN